MYVQRGFTLLEMLVVMVLMGLVTTLALPAMQRWHDGVQTRAQVASIVDSLRAANFKAGASRQDILVDEASFQPKPAVQPVDAKTGAAQADRRPVAAAPALGKPAGPGPEGDAPPPEDASNHLALDLPPRWKTEKVDEIRFLANGLCSPGAIKLRTERGESVTVEVRGPLCGVELAPVTAGASR